MMDREENERRMRLAVQAAVDGDHECDAVNAVSHQSNLAVSHQSNLKDTDMSTRHPHTSDDEIIQMMLSAGLGKASATQMFQERWEQSDALRAEFPEAAMYAGWMHWQLDKARRSSPIAGSKFQPGEETLTAMERQILARNAGRTPEQMASVWQAHWQASAEAQQEFPTAELYATFMTAVLRGRVRIHRGRVQS